MTRVFVCLMILAAACGAATAPLRVAVLDFENQASSGGGQLADRAVYLLVKHLLDQENINLIDRRDFMAQLERLRPTDKGLPTPVRPAFLQAAQGLRADVVLRGVILGASEGKQVVNQGGYRTELTTLDLRVALEALDATDGSVLALGEGKASRSFRQTRETQTTLSESDIIDVLDAAIARAVRDLTAGMNRRAERRRQRKRLQLSVRTSDDPALVEIDGILVGTTPLENFEIYEGDHVLTVGKPGYQDVTKRILFTKDTSIEVPLIRVELTADELKEVLEKMRMHIVVGEPALVIHTVEEPAP
ncbi:MAG TPA: PEGA domain-containing protein [Kiritimatiellae bacterium]|nr:PEGA domain-containing protein [Kiritimatiellia bacterium]